MMNSLIFLCIGLLSWLLVCGLVSSAIFSRRGANILSPGYTVIRQSAPPSFMIWIEQKWKLTSFILGVTENYTDSAPKWSANILKSNRVKLSFTVPQNENIERLSERMEELSDFIDATSYKVISKKRSSIEVILEWGEPEFLTKTVHWASDLRENPVIPQRFPLGMDDDGRVISAPLRGGHTLIAGYSGAGKGSVIWSLVGALAGREDVELHGVDLKDGIEMNIGRQSFHSVSETLDEYADLIDFVHAEMERRAAILKDMDLNDMPISPENPLMVVVIDEAADMSDMAQMPEYKDTLMKFGAIMRKARASGIVIVAALQNPNVSEFKWAKKFPQKIALRMAQSQQGNFMGWDSVETFDMDTLPETIRGVCLLKTDSGQRSLCKAFFLPPETIRRLPSAIIHEDTVSTETIDGVAVTFDYESLRL